MSGLSAGTISALNFAQRIYEMPTSFITNQLGSIAAIKFNELYPLKKFDEFNSAFLNSLQLLIAFLMPVSAALFFFPEEILKLIFLHGNFKIASVDKCAEMLRIFSFMLPLLAINVIVTRTLMATQRLDISFKYQVLIASIVIGLTFVGVHYFKELGYPIAQVVSYLFSAFCLYFVLKFSAPFINYLSILKTLTLLSLINMAIGYILYKLIASLYFPDLVKLILFGFSFGILYAIVLYVSPYRKLFHHLKFNS
jgi:putative peptidoglycan lipid II flippase